MPAQDFLKGGIVGMTFLHEGDEAREILGAPDLQADGHEVFLGEDTGRDTADLDGHGLLPFR